MRIVELKSQNVRIIYRPVENQLRVGDFVSFIEGDLELVAQVSKIFSAPDAQDYNLADLTFVLKKEYNKLNKWDGETLSYMAAVQRTDNSVIEKYINRNENPEFFTLGKSFGYEMPLKLDLKNFKTPAFIGFDKISDNKDILENIAYEFKKHGKKLVVLDFKGDLELDGAQKIIAGIHAKLPLNSSLLENLSSKILDGVSLENKVVIENILLEVAQYAKESKNGFIPLSNFVSVIDNIYKTSKIAQLILLKNKLRKYQKINLFADNSNEVFALFNVLEENSLVVLDVSNIPLAWHKEFFSQVLELNNSMKKNFYLYATLDEQNSDNGLINNLLFKVQNTGIMPILSANYRYLSFENIFDFSQNTFLFKTFTALKKRLNIADIIQSLPNNCLMATGVLTKDLMICTKLDLQEEKIDDIADEVTKSREEIFGEAPIRIEISAQELENTKDAARIDMSALNSALEPEPSINLEIPEEILDNISLDTNEEEQSFTPAQEMLNVGFAETEPIENLPQEEIVNQVLEENLNLNLDQSVALEEVTIENNQPDEVEEIVEIQEDEPVVELEIEDAADDIEEIQDVQEIETIDEVQEAQEMQEVVTQVDEIETEHELNKELLNVLPADIMGEVDEVEEFEEVSSVEVVENSQESDMEDLDVEDLDFLAEGDAHSEVEEPSAVNEDDELFDLLEEDEVVYEEEEFQQEEVLTDSDFEEEEQEAELFEERVVEPIAKQPLPVYNANYEKKEPKISPAFQAGDLVKHQKYGVGTVKKITNHGEKVFCYIDFDDFGRRLLDPEISQLEKL